MKENLIKRKPITLFVVMLLALSFGGLAYADTPTRSTDEYSAFTGQTITAGSSATGLVDMNLLNVSASQGGTVKIYPQQGVNSLEVFINGSSCGSATVGALTPVPFNCDSSILTTAVLQGTANVTVDNNGALTHIFSATLSARYQETRADAIDTSSLATADQLNANTTQILNGQSDIRSDVNVANTSIHTRFDGVDSNLTAIKNETNAIYTTINSESWMDLIAGRVWAYTTRTLTNIAQSIITLT